MPLRRICLHPPPSLHHRSIAVLISPSVPVHHRSAPSLAHPTQSLVHSAPARADVPSLIRRPHPPPCAPTLCSRIFALNGCQRRQLLSSPPSPFFFLTSLAVLPHPAHTLRPNIISTSPPPRTQRPRSYHGPRRVGVGFEDPRSRRRGFGHDCAVWCSAVARDADADADGPVWGASWTGMGLGGIWLWVGCGVSVG